MLSGSYSYQYIIDKVNKTRVDMSSFVRDHEVKLSADIEYYDVAFGMCKLVSYKYVPSHKLYL
jgi:hypothetical protein